MPFINNIHKCPIQSRLWRLKLVSHWTFSSAFLRYKYSHWLANEKKNKKQVGTFKDEKCHNVLNQSNLPDAAEKKHNEYYFWGGGHLLGTINLCLWCSNSCKLFCSRVGRPKTQVRCAPDKFILEMCWAQWSTLLCTSRFSPKCKSLLSCLLNHPGLR